VGGGKFRAVVHAADTGLVKITIDARWPGTEVELLPIPVVPPGETPGPLPLYERGQRLFVAKGCATCHMKQDDPALPEHLVIAVGPPLANRQFDSTWLAAKLANPAGVSPGLAGYFRRATNPNSQMPNLELSGEEIRALVRYINRQSTETNQRRLR
jgi:hypothetical protein